MLTGGAKVLAGFLVLRSQIQSDFFNRLVIVNRTKRAQYESVE